MSLFTGKDQDLPLLTQVQQIRLLDKEGNRDYSELLTFIVGMIREEKRQFISVRDDESMQMAWDACTLSQRIIESLATQKVETDPAVDVNDVRCFRAMLEEFPTYRPTILPAGGTNSDLDLQMDAMQKESGLIRARWIRFLDWRELPPARAVAARILEELGDFINTLWWRYHTAGILYKTPVAICKQCESAYIVLRFTQEYCSDRCSNRARVKRHRERRSVIQKESSG